MSRITLNMTAEEEDLIRRDERAKTINTCSREATRIIGIFVVVAFGLGGFIGCLIGLVIASAK